MTSGRFCQHLTNNKHNNSPEVLIVIGNNCFFDLSIEPATFFLQPKHDAIQSYMMKIIIRTSRFHLATDQSTLKQRGNRSVKYAF